MALAAASELPRLALDDALALTLVLLDRDPARFKRAAARWHARYCLELPGVELSESQLVLALLMALRGSRAGQAARLLSELCGARSEPKLAEVIRRWEVERQPARSMS